MASKLRHVTLFTARLRCACILTVFKVVDDGQVTVAKSLLKPGRISSHIHNVHMQ